MGFVAFSVTTEREVGTFPFAARNALSFSNRIPLFTFDSLDRAKLARETRQPTAITPPYDFVRMTCLHNARRRPSPPALVTPMPTACISAIANDAPFALLERSGLNDGRRSA